MNKKYLMILYRTISEWSNRQIADADLAKVDQINILEMIKKTHDSIPRDPSREIKLSRERIYRRAPDGQDGEFYWQFKSKYAPFVWINVSSPICETLPDFQACFNLMKEELE